MPVKTFVLNEAAVADLSVRVARAATRIPFDAQHGATANAPFPTEFVFERDFGADPSPVFFEAIIKTGEDANNQTASYEVEINGGTAQSWSITEGTAAGWSISQEGPNSMVREQLTFLARTARVDVDGDEAEFSHELPQA